MITVLDYGLGNVSAFTGLFDRLGIPWEVAQTGSAAASATRLILPGVGSFDRAMERLDSTGLTQAISSAVKERHVPILGVCVGMQVLFEGSDEGVRPGLGLLAGRVVAMANSDAAKSLCLPHLGWNSVKWSTSHPLSDGLEAAEFYFLHSFCARPVREADVIGTTVYGEPFASVVASGSIYGIQCHPEKSHASGSRLLTNFATLPVQ